MKSALEAAERPAVTLQSERAVNAVAPARRENGGAAFDATLNDIVVQSLTRTQPETEHTVSVGKLQSWLDGGGKSPNEQVLKSRLRKIL